MKNKKEFNTSKIFKSQLNLNLGFDEHIFMTIFVLTPSNWKQNISGKAFFDEAIGRYIICKRKRKLIPDQWNELWVRTNLTLVD